MSDLNVSAIRYGTLTTTKSASFLDYSSYGEPDAAQQLDYYFWVLTGNGRVSLVDTGFDAEVGRRRGRSLLADPLEALAGLGIDPADVGDIVISHFHYDHIGNLKAFPNARVFYQRRELDFWGPAGGATDEDRGLVENSELAHLLDITAAGRAVILEGDARLWDGVDVHLVGGHTPGQQIVSVVTDDGVVVLASDAVHLYEEMDLRRPYAIANDPPAMVRAYCELERMHSTGARIVAGHDPGVRARLEIPTHKVADDSIIPITS